MGQVMSNSPTRRKREKGRRSDPPAFQKMEDRMKRCSCLASMSIDRRFYKSSLEMLQKI